MVTILNLAKDSYNNMYKCSCFHGASSKVVMVIYLLDIAVIMSYMSMHHYDSQQD
jgi:hypothetical protein